MTTYRISPETSTVLVGARSTMGPIVFEGREVRGSIEASLDGDTLDTDAPVTASLDIEVSTLQSGNELYDAELHRRLDARRFPVCHAELQWIEAQGADRFVVAGNITLHDTTQYLTGTVVLERCTPGQLVVVGEKTVDIRDFDVSAPNLMLLRIYPDVQVRIFLDAHTEIDEVTS